MYERFTNVSASKYNATSPTIRLVCSFISTLVGGSPLTFVHYLKAYRYTNVILPLNTRLGTNYRMPPFPESNQGVQT